MNVGAASLNALRMTFVLEAEATSFDTEVVAYLSHLAGEDHMRLCGSCQPHLFILSETHRMLESVAKLLGFSWTSGTSESTRNTSHRPGLGRHPHHQL